jgi:hypothetical protein
MADPGWKVDLRQLVAGMDPGKQAELFAAIARTKQLAEDKEKAKALSADDQADLWLRRNEPLASAIRDKLDSKVNLGLSEWDQEGIREVIGFITAGYKYAFGEWSASPGARSSANESVSDAQGHAYYKLFQEIAKKVSTDVAIFEEDARQTQAAAVNKARQEQEKRDKEEAQKLLKRKKDNYYERLKGKGTKENEVVCLLIAPGGTHYYASNHDDLGALHSVAKNLAGGDSLDHPVRNCAEFKALNQYLNAECRNVESIQGVPKGGHTICYVYKIRNDELVPMSKAACGNCQIWLSKLHWTTEPGDF